MRILLIRPAQIRWSDEGRRVGTPTGLLSIAAALRRDHDVAFVDAAAEGYNHEVEVRPGVMQFGLSDDEVLRRLDEFNPHVVGISDLFTLYWGVTFQLVSRIKQQARHVVTVLGGHHASEAAREILELDDGRAIDYIVLREGEETIVELMRAIEGGCPVAQLSGIAYRDATGQPHTTMLRPTISLLDGLADPAWDLLDARHYCAAMSHHGPPRGANFIDVMFSRGCPVGCHFCTSTTYWGSRFRVFSQERVREQVATLVELGWEEFVVEDDNFAALPFDVQRQICTALKETGLPWCNDGGLYLPLLEEKRVGLLAESGCYRVFLPVETPKVRTMQAQRKYRSFRDDGDFLRKIRQVTALLREARIEFYSALMVGFPGETTESLRHSCEFASFLIGECGAFGVAFHWVHNYPGTLNYRPFSGPPDWHVAPETFTFTRPDPSFTEGGEIAREMRRWFPQPSRIAASGGADVSLPMHHSVGALDTSVLSAPYSATSTMPNIGSVEHSG